MLRRSQILFVVLVVTAVTSSAVAQEQPGRRPPRGGFGGFGGGGFGGPGGPQGAGPNLLMIPEVQEELGLTDEQKKPIEDARRRL